MWNIGNNFFQYQDFLLFFNNKSHMIEIFSKISNQYLTSKTVSNGSKIISMVVWDTEIGIIYLQIHPSNSKPRLVSASLHHICTSTSDTIDTHDIDSNLFFEGGHQILISNGYLVSTPTRLGNMSTISYAMSCMTDTCHISHKNINTAVVDIRKICDSHEHIYYSNITDLIVKDDMIMVSMRKCISNKSITDVLYMRSPLTSTAITKSSILSLDDTRVITTTVRLLSTSDRLFAVAIDMSRSCSCRILSIKKDKLFISHSSRPRSSISMHMHYIRQSRYRLEYVEWLNDKSKLVCWWIKDRKMRGCRVAKTVYRLKLNV